MLAKQIIEENLNILEEGKRLDNFKKNIKKASLPLGIATIIGSATLPAIRLMKAPEQIKQHQEVRAEQARQFQEVYNKRVEALRNKITELKKGIPARYEHEKHTEIWNIFRQYQGDIPDLFLETLVEIESQWHPNATRKNVGGSYDSGLMQVNTEGALAQYNKAHKTEYTKEQAKDLNLNIRIGTYYLHWLVNNYNVSYNNPELLYIKYHRGPNATEHNTASRQFMAVYNRNKKEKEDEIKNKIERLEKDMIRLIAK
ncbi:MAG: transglycosylase SLT domain-containing protein [Elusimicrobiota bacterium]|jgi:soluble lytic murein transglycosylase-like protein|nr:transglycosylase SLT domain-containing protein [Elusimicrobiota bacterium]